MKHFFALGALAALTSCSEVPLYVQNDFLHVEGLASAYVHTPDPHREKPLLGQRLYITWSLDPDCLRGKETCLVLHLRFCNREERQVCEPICSSSGSYEYRIVCEDFFNTGGILAYKVEIVADGQVIEEWNHQIWTAAIHIDEE